MADSDIPGLTALATVSDSDVYHIVDVSDTSSADDGTDKKITRANLLGSTEADFANNIKTDTISESTAGTGVTVDSVLLQDGKVDTGQGATEVYAMDQDLQTSDSPTFGNLGAKSVITDVKSSAYLSANQLNLTDATWTTVTLDTETWDPGSNFDNSTNYDFTAPVTGYYSIVYQVQFTGASLVADKDYSARIYDGASSLAADKRHAALTGAGDGLGVGGSAIIKLTASDALVLQAFADTGVNTVDIFGQSDATFMHVHLLSID